VPVNATACGLPAALSENESAAVFVPVDVGRKVTDTVHEAPTASVEPQVVVRLKLDAFVPVIVIPEIVIAHVPEFVNVTVRALLVVLTRWRPKDSDVGDSVATGLLPVPDNETVCGLPAALSVMLSVAARVPTAVGVNVTLMVQLDPAATVVHPLTRA
jgi:hypothetical protein